MMSVKKIIGKLHLWLGISSGLVVFIVAITGCIYAFQEELKSITQTYRFVEPEKKDFLAPSKLEIIAREKIPDRLIHGVKYGQPDEAIEVIFYEPEPLFYWSVFINPYSGKVIHEKNNLRDFFYLALLGHYKLWIPGEIGTDIIDYSTLIFVVLLISGIILWWPKNKAAKKQRFKFNWKKGVSAKRKNYDLHNVLGFYASFIAVIIAVTGLLWGFKSFESLVYSSLGGKKSLEWEYVNSESKADNFNSTNKLDWLWYKMNQEYTSYRSMEVHIPETDSSSIFVEIQQSDGLFYDIDYRFFDQYSLQEIIPNHRWGEYGKAELADKFLRLNYDIHTGSILGLPGKFLAFFASLIVASLPITGVRIYLGRRKKRKKG